MQFLLLSTRSAARVTRGRPVHLPSPQILRPFSGQARLFIKEDADRSADEIEKHKQDHLKKQEKGEGHWDRNLASRGEESIAADKQSDHVEDHEEHMGDLQKQTAGRSEKEHLHGKAEE